MTLQLSQIMRKCYYVRPTIEEARIVGENEPRATGYPWRQRHGYDWGNSYGGVVMKSQNSIGEGFDFIVEEHQAEMHLCKDS